MSAALVDTPKKTFDDGNYECLRKKRSCIRKINIENSPLQYDDSMVNTHAGICAPKTPQEELLMKRFPDVPNGIITALLMTANNDISVASELIQNIRVSNSRHTSYNDEGEHRGRLVGTKKRSLHSPAFDGDENMDPMSKVPQQIATDFDKDKASTSETHVHTYSNAETIVEEYRQRIMRLLMNANCITTAEFQLQNELKDFYNRASKAESPVLSRTNAPQTENGLNAAQHKIEQLSNAQRLLVRALKAQHDKIQALQLNEKRVVAEKEELKNEVQRTNEMLRKESDARNMLQYLITTHYEKEESTGTNYMFFRRNPDIF